jgi:hypothetical protein
MARSRVADGADGLQIWRVAVNLLNKQSQTANEMWSSSFEVGRRANSSSPKKQLVTKCYTGSLERPKQRKIDMIFETWNVQVH